MSQFMTNKLKLVLLDISRHMDEQIETLRAENDELRALKVKLNGEVPDDRWGQYLTMDKGLAYKRLIRDKEYMEAECDAIAAEG